MGRDHSSGKEGTLSDADTVILTSKSSGQRGLAETLLVTEDFQQRFEPEGTLGEGGMGAVLLYRDRQIGRRVAVKEIRPELAKNPEAQARFLREARIQGQLEHPAVVPVHDLGTTPAGTIYFSMKRVQGTALDEILQQLRAADPQAAQIYTRRKLLATLSSVCLAIDFAHRRGVVHRDLKPANIMLGEYGEVYVLDWGIAKLIESPGGDSAAGVDDQMREPVATLPGAIIGSPGYMAPEQLTGPDQEVGPESDVYALGCILFEVLTLRPLIEVETVHEHVAAFALGQDAQQAIAACDHELPPELVAICLQATANHAEERYRSARQLHEALERYLSGERNVELSGKLAEQHAGRARQLAEGAARSLDERREAMREIGRALALDPSNESAMSTMISLLNQPPETLPPEVRGEMARSRTAAYRQTGRIGAVAYASFVLYVPLLWWLGMRDSTAIWLFLALAAISTAVSVWTVRSRRPSQHLVVAAMILSNLMFVCLWPLFGPLVMLPTILVANAIAYGIHLDRDKRALGIVVGVLAVVVPVVLEVTGAVSPSYRLSDAGMLILPGTLGFSPGSLFLLTLVSVVALVTGALVVGRVRDALRDAEQQLYLYAWHMREFVPHAVRPATDPTGARRVRQRT